MSRVTDILNGKRRISDAQKAVFDGLSPRDTYRVLEFYYLSNGLYAMLHANNGDDTIWTEGMLGLRNPAHRVVEFYVGKLWSDDLVIATENARIVEPIQQIWKWSNWAAKKQVFARWFACFGDAFLKVAASGDGQRVFFQVLKPEFVSEIDEDERGFLTFCRIDIPQTRRDADGNIEAYTYTETWDKATGQVRIWEHKRGDGEPVDRLGAPKETRLISDYGIDFIPIVHAKFQDIGHKRGVGAFTHALDKIDEANRMSTRLHQLLYRYEEPIWAISANDKDNSGRPLPAPSLGSDTDGAIDGSSTRYVRLPGLSTLNLMIPQIAYDQALSILNAQILDLMHDLPELAYYAIRERTGEITGRAARILLGDMIAKAEEARGNAEDALARADAMALTIGQAMGLFNGLGSYEAGDFEHTFAQSDIISLSESERAEAARNYTQAGAPFRTAARRVGWAEADLSQMDEDAQAEQQQNADSLAAVLAEQQRRFDAGLSGKQVNGEDTGA